jgi:hypothetical protein
MNSSNLFIAALLNNHNNLLPVYLLTRISFRIAIDDLDTLISKLVSGSVLIVTVSAEQDRPSKKGWHIEEINKFREDKLRKRLPNEKIPIDIKSIDLTGKNLGNLYKK